MTNSLSRKLSLYQTNSPRTCWQLFVIASIGLVLNPALAEDTPVLKEVQVINTSPLPGIGIEKYKLPYEVQSVDSEAIRKSGSLNMSEFMNENLTGVNVNDIQGSPYQADVTYRGMRASATLGASQGLSIYMDGVRMNQPFGDVVNWDMFPEAAIDTVTLVPGSNPIYGLNTLGGALAFTTKSGLTTQGNEVVSTIGSYGRLKLDVTHGSKSADGWHRFIAGTAFDEAGWRDHSSGSLQNLFVKIGKTQEDTNWDVSYMFGNSKLVGNGLTPSTNYGELTAVSSSNTTTGLYEADRASVYTWPDQTINKAHVLSFNMQHVLDANTELASTAYVKYGEQSRLGGDVEWDDTVNPEEAVGVINRNSTKQTTVGVATNLTKILDNHQITTGATLERSKMSYGASEAEDCYLNPSTREVSTSTGCESELTTAGVTGTSTAFGTYLADTYKLSDKTFVTVAGRFNQTTVANTLTSYDDAGASEGSESESFTYRKFNPSFGMTHQLGAQLTVFGNWAQSNRAPTVLELGCADPDEPCALPTGLQADPYLSQVVSQTLEAGMRWKNDFGYNLSISAYRTINKDDIIFVSKTSTTGYFDNFSKTQYMGIDINANKIWGAWKFNTAYSYLKATYESSASLLGAERIMSITPGMRMAGIPLHKLKMHLDWAANENWKLGTSMIVSSSIVTQGNEDGYIADGVSGDAKVNGYALFNLNATYKVQKGFEIFGKINNVFNKNYETYAMLAADNLYSDDEQTLSKFVAPGAPRTYMAGLRYKF